MTTKLTNAARERGISLIESVLYLVIALAVIVGGIVFFQQAQLSSGVTDTSRALVSISSETRGLYRNQRSFGANQDDLAPALLKAGAVPSNFQDSNGNIVHPFGGNISVEAYEDTFAVILDGLDEAACARLAPVGEGGQGSAGTNIVGVTTPDEGAPVFEGAGNLPGMKDSSTIPYTAATAGTDCTDEGRLAFMYGR